MESTEKHLSITRTSCFTSNTPTLSTNDFSIISIKTKSLTINDILRSKVDYNDDVYIFEITGKTKKFPSISWKIYKNNKQIKELFEQIKKDLPKKVLEYDKIINICKMIKKIYKSGSF